MNEAHDTDLYAGLARRVVTSGEGSSGLEGPLDEFDEYLLQSARDITGARGVLLVSRGSAGELVARGSGGTMLAVEGSGLPARELASRLDQRQPAILSSDAGTPLAVLPLEDANSPFGARQSPARPSGLAVVLIGMAAPQFTIERLRTLQGCIERLRKSHQLLRESAFDAGTGLWNRQSFMRQLRKQSDWGIPPSSVILVAVVDYERIRAEHGRLLAGDVMSALADLVSTTLPVEHQAARFAEDELAIYLPAADHGSAQRFISRLQLAVRRHAFAGGEDVDVSIGLALVPDDAETPEAAVHHAHQAMALLRSECTPGVMRWSADGDRAAGRADELLSGVVVGDPVADYRNIRILLDALELTQADHPREEVLAGVVDRAIQYTGADRGIILLATPDGELQPEVVRHKNSTGARHAGWSREIAQAVYESRQPQLHTAPLDQPGPVQSIVPSRLQTVMCAALQGRSRVYGVLYVDGSAESRQLVESDLAFFHTLAREVARALEFWDLRRTAQRTRLQLLQAQKMDAMGALAGGVAHDFNNILAVIIGYAELLLGEAQTDSVVTGRVDGILRAGERGRELVQRILAFCRRSEGARYPMPASQVAQEALHFLRATLPTTIEIIPRITTENTTILGNPTQLHQVIMNLGTNAQHAMERTGGTLEISMDVEDLAPCDNVSPSPHVVLRVRDTGCGIPPTVRDHIFDPFFTTKELGKGTGIGLAAVQGIVEEHGGTVSVETAEGEGTCFTITFPRIESEEPGNEASIREAERGSGRILFVDDEPALVEMAETMLDTLGYEVVAVCSSATALDLFSANPSSFDLVMTDQTMPGLTGLQLAEKLLEIRSDIPIVICTGHSDLVPQGGTPPPGIRESLRKPFRLKELGAVVRRATGG